jgi:hypothetical protein
MALHEEVIIILGKRGYGKSTWLQKYGASLPRIFIFDPLKKFPAEYVTGDELITRFEEGKLKDGPLKIACHQLIDFDVIGSIAYLSGNNHFIIEECGYCFFKGERIPEWLQELVFLGRHQGVSLIMTAQRAASIPIELRSQASRFISFRQTETSDIKWTGEYIGDRYKELPHLEKLECLDSDGDSVSHYRITHNSQ